MSYCIEAGACSVPGQRGSGHFPEHSRSTSLCRPRTCGVYGRHRPRRSGDFDPFGNAVAHGAHFPGPRETSITGAGPIGSWRRSSLVTLARVTCHHRRVDYRLELARSVGLTLASTCRTRASRRDGQLGMREGFDVGLEMSGRASALQEMLANMAHAGRSPCWACRPSVSGSTGPTLS